MSNKILKALSQIIRYKKRIGVYAAIKLQFVNRIKSLKIIKIKIKLFGKDVDISLRSSTTDISVFHQIFIKRDYDFIIPFTPVNILDAGANIGLSTLFFLKKYPSSNVFAIEPDRENFEMLELNTKNEANIYRLNNALWNKSCFLKINHEISNKDGITVCESNTDCNVSALSVNDIESLYGISGFDIVKMDIEGSEAIVFANNLEWLKNVRILIIEIHDWSNKDCSKNVFRALLNWGLYSLTSGENLIFFRDYNDYMKSLNKIYQNECYN